jgi:hypothetical protein
MIAPQRRVQLQCPCIVGLGAGAGGGAGWGWAAALSEMSHERQQMARTSTARNSPSCVLYEGKRTHGMKARTGEFHPKLTF